MRGRTLRRESLHPAQLRAARKGVDPVLDFELPRKMRHSTHANLRRIIRAAMIDKAHLRDKQVLFRLLNAQVYSGVVRFVEEPILLELKAAPHEHSLRAKELIAERTRMLNPNVFELEIDNLFFSFPRGAKAKSPLRAALNAVYQNPLKSQPSKLSASPATRENHFPALSKTSF